MMTWFPGAVGDESDPGKKKTLHDDKNMEWLTRDRGEDEPYRCEKDRAKAKKLCIGMRTQASWNRRKAGECPGRCKAMLQQQAPAAADAGHTKDQDGPGPARMPARPFEAVHSPVLAMKPVN
ncbi:hypothetical protein CYMTET_50984 [Cymbomonas tetramitiformis]|uniref:Uncharacterized protein n=1 Tax=Cymbomonas tetramitiformis TaxID=36881 RepID=A0AAE0EU77_9CHLO|nr:hypothetical protein CYMTET_50984 [Cymbomonas tetramitiformis]